MSSTIEPVNNFSESIVPKVQPVINQQSNGWFSNKNSTIIFLLLIIIFLMLTNNSFTYLFQNIFKLFYNFVMNILKLFGYTAGTALNTTADIAGNIAKTGIDISEGTVHSIGNILADKNNTIIDNQYATHENKHITHSKNDNMNHQDDNKDGNNSSLEHSVNNSKHSKHEPEPDSTTNPIQNTIASGKTNWCLVGEYLGRRGCIEINDHTKCISGQIFPSETICLNPSLFHEKK